MNTQPGQRPQKMTEGKTNDAQYKVKDQSPKTSVTDQVIDRAIKQR